MGYVMNVDTLNLFSLSGQLDLDNQPSVDAPQISGLLLYADFVSPEVEAKILAALELRPWITDIERRVQHFGYRYNYKARRIDETMRVGDLPKWLTNLAARLVKLGYFEDAPDQVIVNEYYPGQGITAHVDCEPCFGDTVASLSLGSACFMGFSRRDRGDRASIWLEPRSLVVLKNDARYAWRHAIAKRMFDVRNGERIPRGRRVSLTFRKVKASWLEN